MFSTKFGSHAQTRCSYAPKSAHQRGWASGTVDGNFPHWPESGQNSNNVRSDDMSCFMGFQAKKVSCPICPYPAILIVSVPAFTNEYHLFRIFLHTFKFNFGKRSSRTCCSQITAHLPYLTLPVHGILRLVQPVQPDLYCNLSSGIVLCVKDCDELDGIPVGIETGFEGVDGLSCYYT